MRINWFKDENHLVYINGATQLAELERKMCIRDRSLPTPRHRLLAPGWRLSAHGYGRNRKINY